MLQGLSGLTSVWRSHKDTRPARASLIKSFLVEQIVAGKVEQRLSIRPRGALRRQPPLCVYRPMISTDMRVRKRTPAEKDQRTSDAELGTLRNMDAGGEGGRDFAVCESDHGALGQSSQRSFNFISSRPVIRSPERRNDAERLGRHCENRQSGIDVQRDRVGLRKAREVARTASKIDNANEDRLCDRGTVSGCP